jgi:hypothetical protein
MNVHKMARLTPLRRGELVAVVGRGVAIDHPLRRLGVAGTTGRNGSHRLLDFSEIIRRELELGRPKILLEPMQLGGAGNRYDPGLE